MIIPFPEWLPDQPEFGNPGSPTISNCVPQTINSYGPMPTIGVFSTNALDARCQGSYSLYDAAGVSSIFAGDETKLYRRAAPSTSFADVSRSVGGAYATPSVAVGGAWSFTAFGARVIATNGIDEPQSLLMGTDTLFSDLSADAPIAECVGVIKDFVFFGGIVGAPYRVHWSAVGDPTSYPTPGTLAAIQVLSDYQDLQQADLGRVRGIVGNLASADGAIFMEHGIYRLQFVGSGAVFSFQVAQGASGTRAPGSLVSRPSLAQAGAPPVVYYLGDNGFMAFDGAASSPIGSQKFDETIMGLIDHAYLPTVLGTADPQRKLIVWAFMSNGSAGLYDKLVVYNWALGRAALCDLVATPLEWVTRSIHDTGYTLEQLDAFGTLDTLPASLDDPMWAGSPDHISLSAFNATHELCTFTGPAMAPALETSETQPVPGRRSWVTNTRPITDGGAASIAVGHRERTTDPVVYEAAVPANVIGECPQRVTGRYIRYRMTLPAGETFSHIQGVDVAVRPNSTRR
jgi:hypothetical protein